jgi:uncharacterized RDD family membrane protein YckC
MARAGTRAPEALRPAGLATRLLAAGVDAVVLAVCLEALHFGLLALQSVVLLSLPGKPVSAGVLVLAPVVLVPAYFVAFWSLAGWTPGKWLFGLRVVRLDGRPPGLARSIVRFVAYTVSIAPLLAGIAAIAFDPRRRAWHDRIARTLVVHGPSAPARRVRVRTHPSRP